MARDVRGKGAVVAGSDDAWKALAQANDWIKVADAKAGALLAGSGVLGGFVVRALPSWEDWGSAAWHHSFLLLSTLCLATSICFSLAALMPKLTAGEPRSLLYFDHIARRYDDVQSFKNDYLTVLEHEEHMREQLTEQLWAVSRAARRKFVLVTRSLVAIVAALALAGVAGLLKGY